LKGKRMEVVTFKAPREMMEEVDSLVRTGAFDSRSDAIRYAIGMLISQSGCEGARGSREAV